MTAWHYHELDSERIPTNKSSLFHVWQMDEERHFDFGFGRECRGGGVLPLVVMRNKALKGGNSIYGGSPSAISIIMIPKLQISTLALYSCPRINSGAIQYGVPTIVVLFALVSVSCAAYPKSANQQQSANKPTKRADVEQTRKEAQDQETQEGSRGRWRAGDVPNLISPLVFMSKLSLLISRWIL